MGQQVIELDCAFAHEVGENLAFFLAPQIRAG
jgi:hypothetical protein